MSEPKSEKQTRTELKPKDNPSLHQHSANYDHHHGGCGLNLLTSMLRQIAKLLVCVRKIFLRQRFFLFLKRNLLFFTLLHPS